MLQHVTNGDNSGEDLLSTLTPRMGGSNDNKTSMKTVWHNKIWVHVMRTCKMHSDMNVNAVAVGSFVG